MDHDRCLDWVINEENFVENSLIEIEDLRVQHDKQFVDSKLKKQNDFKMKNDLLMKHQVKENFVDVVMIVSLHLLDYDVDEYLDFVLMDQYSIEIVVEVPK